MPISGKPVWAVPNAVAPFGSEAEAAETIEALDMLFEGRNKPAVARQG